jgi:hypothetical protein
VAVRAECDGAGYAIASKGRVRLETISGIAVIVAGKLQVTVPIGLNVPGDAFVILTPQANIGGRSLWAVVDAASDRFTVRLSRARQSDLRVAWLLLEG